MWCEDVGKCSGKGSEISISESSVFEEGECSHEPFGTKTLKSQTVRRCLVSRRVVPKEHLIRFIAAPDGTVVPDLRCNLPGRGVWVTAQRGAVDQAVSRGLFIHGLRNKVKVSPSLGQEVDVCLENRALQALAFAHKAGACRVGYNQVNEALKAGKAVGLFGAIEASEDQWNKLEQLAFFRYREKGGVKIHVFRGFSTDLLSQIFAKSGVFYGALLDHVANKGYLVCVDRLMWYRTSSAS